MEMHIRDATEADLPAIVEIYNQSIPAGWSTADTKPITVAERVEWFRKFDPAKRPIWVVEVEGQVVATAYLSSFYAGRPAYDATAEISQYIATAYHRKGIGRRLKQWVIEQCPRLGVTTLLSMHFDHNEGTRRINESLGFEQMGHLTEIAVVQGHKRGLVISALRIPARAMPATEPEVDLVRELAMLLPDVEEATLHGVPSWKLRGKLLTCPAIHKSAEPNSLLVKIAPLEREQLLSTEPGTYYMTDHYLSQPVILVRLSKINRTSLQALLKRAWLFVNDSGNRRGRKARQTPAK